MTSEKSSLKIIEEVDHFLRRVARPAAFLESSEVNNLGKVAVAKYVIEHLLSETSIILDAGTSSFETAKLLISKRNASEYTIFTNNLAIMLLMSHGPAACHIIGGEVDPSHYCTLPSLNEALGTVPPDVSRAIVTAASIRVRDGILLIRARKPHQFALKQHLFFRKGSVILVADHTKWTAPFDGTYEFLVERRDIDVLTDESTPLSVIDAVRTAGFRVHVAKQNGER